MVLATTISKADAGSRGL